MALVAFTDFFQSKAQYQFVGLPSSSANVAFRFRGCVELALYTGGTNDGAFFQTGGTPTTTLELTAKLEISSPVQVYYLNRSAAPPTNLVALDYSKVLTVNEGAIMSLTLDNVDLVQYASDASNQPISVPPFGYFYSQFMVASFTHPNDLRTIGGGPRGAVWSGFEEAIFGVGAER